LTRFTLKTTISSTEYSISRSKTSTRTTATAAREREGEEGAITKSDQTVGAGGEHRLERIFRERGIAGGPHAAYQGLEQKYGAPV
jgi:hypothetical protein